MYKRKNIYIILHTLSIGGAERHASSIANYLSECGFNVTIILIQDNRVEYALNNSIRVIALQDLLFPESIKNYKATIIELFLLKLFKATNQRKYQLIDKNIYLKSVYLEKLKWVFYKEKDISNSIVISFMTIPNLCSSELKKTFHYQLIMGEFTAPQLEFSNDAPENGLKKDVYPNADVFVFQTEEQKAFYSYLSDVRKCIIPNPIENINVEPYKGTREKTIVNYCKHVKAKNLPLLIESFAKLNIEYPDYSLVIYGDGPEKAETENCIKKHSLENKVILKPYDKDVLEKVRRSAMFVSSSDREGISNSMLEAMAIGLPVICTDCPAGGARMFIKNYENGILVPVRDSEALYKAMKYIIDNPDKSKQMGKNAIDIRDTLNKNKILKIWLDLIESL